MTSANQISLIIDQGVIGPTGPSGALGPTGPTGVGIELKGTVNTPAQLPLVGNQPGDAYVVINP